jgi:hypothetical protein
MLKNLLQVNGTCSADAVAVNDVCVIHKPVAVIELMTPVPNFPPVAVADVKHPAAGNTVPIATAVVKSIVALSISECNLV